MRDTHDIDIIIIAMVSRGPHSGRIRQTQWTLHEFLGVAATYNEVWDIYAVII